MCLFFNSSTKLKQEETKCEKETQKSNGKVELRIYPIKESFFNQQKRCYFPSV